jgi:hypothetical protein
MVLLVAALVVAIMSAMGKAPLWIAVVVLTLAVALLAFPGRV